MYLPFWSAEINVEIPPWFPYGRDYTPVSVNRFFDSALESIAASSMDMNSEFLFLASPTVGCVGNLPRERFFRHEPENFFNLGFLMIFGFSDEIEKALMLSVVKLEAAKGLMMGVTTCALWRDDIFVKRMKAIAIVSDDPFYDCSEYLKGLAKLLEAVRNIVHAPKLSYYAEKFGYDRFVIKLEGTDPYTIRTSQIISEIEDDGVREIVGGSPQIDFPPFFGLSVTITQN